MRNEASSRASARTLVPRQVGRADDTAVFFSSDHGDFAGDFHLVEKWPGGADDVLTRVPLLARVPGGARGGVAKFPVQLFGLDVAGDGSGAFGVNFARDLSPQLLGDGAEGDLARFVYSEGGFSTANELFPGGSDHVDEDDPTGMYWPRAQEEMSAGGTGSPRWVMRRNLTAKVVHRPRTGDSELYDLAADPRELTNLWGAPAHAALQAELLAGLLDWYVETADVTPTHADPRGVPAYPYPASACAVEGTDGPL